ncbi:MAG: L,D-transpeptidase family protein [bacterium]
MAKICTRIFATSFLSAFVLSSSIAAQALPNNPDTTISRTIRTVIAATHHPRMKWPDFPFYKDEMEGLYQPLAFQPFWLVNGQPRPQIRDAVDILLYAETRGLDPEDYDASRLDAQARQIQAGAGFSAEDLALFDTQLSLALFRQISDVHIGKINPKNLKYGINIESKKYFLPELVRASVEKNRLHEMIQEAEPDYPLYRDFKKALARYRRLAKEATFSPLPAKATVHSGEPYAGLPQLQHWLHALGDLPLVFSNGDSGIVYQGAIVEAVKKFQSRHGLQADGVLGKGTFAALNVPPARRCRQIEFAMERLRWLPELRDGPFIFVNVTAFRMYAFDSLDAEGMPTLLMDVIVGKALDTETPVFIENLQYIEFRPYWYVPLNIVRRTVIPAAQKNPAHFLNSGFEVLRGNNVLGQEVTPEILSQLESGSLRLRQKPGLANALGPAKFIFPNNSNVYIHGTPSRSLFSRARRDLSSGCVRIEDPATLSLWVLQDQPEWNRERIVKAMEGEQPTRVFLKNPLPVIIFYTTAIVRPSDGTVFFYEDIYQHDKMLEEALLAGEPYAP